MTAADRVCRALRWTAASGGGGVLQERSWSPGGTPPPAWATLASQLRLDRAGYARPFEVLAPSDDVAHQRLRVRLVAVATSGGAARPSDVTLTAVNWNAGTARPC